jgi:phage-related minor tail protein
MATSIVEYSEIEMVLSDLTSRYKGIIYDVATIKGMNEAKAAKKEIAQYRIALEKTRVRLKEDSLKRGRLIDSEAKPIAASLDALETPIDDQIKAKERAEQAARETALKAEMERIAAEAQAKKDAEERAIAEQRAEIAKQQAALAEAQRVANAEANAARLKIEQEQREARAKIEQEERAARLAREESDRIARQAREVEAAKEKAIRDAEEARLKAEREAIDAKRREVEAQERKEREAAEAKARAEREAEEAKQREIQRQKNELLDARAMLTTFQAKFGHLPEFAGVVTAINLLFRGQ